MFLKAVLAFISVVLVHSVCGDVRSLCPGVCPIRRNPFPAEGIWWTVLATETSTGQCGILNNQCPCKCVGIRFCSSFAPPFTPAYNMTTFGYDTRECCYEEQFQYLDVVDRKEPWIVVYITDKLTGVTYIAAVLDTDDCQTFILIYVCDLKTEEGEPLVFVIARDIRGLCKETEKRIISVLKANYICPNKLKRINRRNCPYYVP